MENNEVRTCPKCGAEVAENTAFCPLCGEALAAPAAEPVAEVVAEVVAEPAVVATEPVQVEQQPKKKKKTGLIIGIVAGVVAIFVAISILLCGLGGCAALMFGGSEDFNDMYSKYSGESWCTIADDGSWMRIDTNPDDYDDDYLYLYYDVLLEACDAVQEINSDLGFGSYVYQEMQETNSLQGRQTEETDKYTVSWTYHPDSGLEVLYSIK